MALDYLKGLMRMAPVRLCSMSGMLVGRWAGYAQLLSTELRGDMINVVCCDPSRWTWLLRVPAPPRDILSPQVASSDAVHAPPEILTGRQELYTVGGRNVLIAATTSPNAAELETALRYEALVVPDAATFDWWDRQGGDPRLIPTPVTDHAAFYGCVVP